MLNEEIIYVFVVVAAGSFLPMCHLHLMIFLSQVKLSLIVEDLVHFYFTLNFHYSSIIIAFSSVFMFVLGGIKSSQLSNPNQWHHDLCTTPYKICMLGASTQERNIIEAKGKE